MKTPQPRSLGPYYGVDPNARDLSPQALNPAGRLKVLPTAFWAGTTPAERFRFGVRHGLYSFPTVELVAQLKQIIDGRTAIEIGAGHGQLAHALGIIGTDSKEQEATGIKVAYALQGQQTVKYGPSVVKMDGNSAVRHFKPQVVIACWVTQDATADEWEYGLGKGNGIDEADILTQCETYIFIGNEEVHKGKRIWSLPHTIAYPEYVVSRAVNGSRDFLAVWPGGRATVTDWTRDALALKENDSDRSTAA